MNKQEATLITALFVGAMVAVLGCTVIHADPSFKGALGDQLLKRASFDLECPADQLDVVVIDASTRGVTGCGRKGAYVEHCTGLKGFTETTCTWIINSEKK